MELFRGREFLDMRVDLQERVVSRPSSSSGAIRSLKTRKGAHSLDFRAQLRPTLAPQEELEEPLANYLAIIFGDNKANDWDSMSPSVLRALARHSLVVLGCAATWT